MPEYPSGTVAFLFTDIEGSTRRWESHHQQMQVAVERHFRLIGDVVNAHDGVLFKTIGDAVQAAFPSVPAAVTTAIEAQAALRAEDWGEIGPLRVRMAVHVGEATPRDGDYLAPALNRLARALATGYGEQILLTEAARALATAPPPGHALRDLGRHRLRDLLEAEHLYQVTGPGLPADFPPLKSLDTWPNNLPAQPTPLIGRETELAALRQAVTSPATRLITLTGPGGAGKTRLALQVAAEVVDAFPDGVWWAPLASISDPALAPEAIATALGVRELAEERMLSTLTTFLQSRKLLIVLDNLEQVIEAGPLIANLLNAAPGLVVLATSREPLRLRAEQEFPVAPLPLPEGREIPPPDEARTVPSVQLFIERAQGVKPSFDLTAENVADVVAICRRLDGLPLAIELAAARIRILTPAALLARLDQQLSLLTGGARDLPERQQTLRAAIAWSHDLLDADEQALFARLAVFTSGSTVDAAESMLAVAGNLGIDLLDGIDSLVQKSLLRQGETSYGDVRFTMLQSIREFAQERLAELPDAAKVHQAHADTFFLIAENADWDDLEHQADLLDRLEADHANFRQALDHFQQQGGDGVALRLRLAAALSYFWWVRGHLTEGRGVLDSALAAEGKVRPLDRAEALSGAALLAEAQWDLEPARAMHEEALALRREAGDLRGVAGSLTGLAVIARNEGDLDRAQLLHQEALDAWRATNDAAGVAGATLDLGIVSQMRGDDANAAPLLRESLERFARIHDLAGEASAHQWLGVLAITTGDLAGAANHFNESLARWRRLENPQMTAMDLANLGEAKQIAGSLDEAEALYREALALHKGLGDPVGQGVVLGLLGRLTLDRGDAMLAIDQLRDALRLGWDYGDRSGAADALDALAEAALQRGERAWAAEMLQASDRIHAETGIRRTSYYALRYARIKEAQDIAAPAQSLSIEETIRKALSGTAPLSQRPQTASH